tara:strand:+ start:3982 stop:4419 length:438 start_codon:yes stop_codon:yes gene_type:complete
MEIKFCFLLLFLSACFTSDKHKEELKAFDINVDSLFLAADGAVDLIINTREQKILLEQDLWRKLRDIKDLNNKVDAYHDSMFEMSELRMGEDSVVYNYKIVLKTIIDTVRINVTDTICNVCETKQNKKDNRWYKKTFRWIKNIEI